MLMAALMACVPAVLASAKFSYAGLCYLYSFGGANCCRFDQTCFQESFSFLDDDFFNHGTRGDSVQGPSL